ncbi:MAG TPA: S41 family peptidase [Bacteroidales bacterium]|nr:S41 family peptidase [Bacteroidales bacterium]
MRKIVLFFIIGMFLQGAVAMNDARLIRFPHISGDLIAFVFAGDIWTVPAAGGDARRLTSHNGLELFPKISPDGKWIAFSAEYSGTRQIHVMQTDGGTPRQLTFYNDVGPMPQRGGFDHVALGWTSDSKRILFRANRTEYGDRMSRYFLINVEGGFEEELPIPFGGFGVLSPDNRKMAFTWPDREFRTWKRYKGGRASNIWIYDLERNHSEQITDWLGTDQIPHWYGNKIFFASDRDLRLNIYSFDLKTRETAQLTFHKDFDVMWPSGTNNQLVYESGGQLFRLDLGTGTKERVVVNIHFDQSNTLPYFKNVKEHIHSVAISPSGNRVLIDARGDIFSVPAGPGTIHNLTNTQGAREVFPMWSPDGKWIAYFSDQPGEYEVFLLENIEGAQPRQVTRGSRGWKYQPEWSPNSKYLLYFDRSMRLQLLDVASGFVTVVDTPTFEEIRSFDFSPDSRWITYVKSGPNAQGAIWVFNIETGQRTQLTDHTFSDSNPVFSNCGHYIFFTSNRDFNLTFSSFEFNYLYTNAARIYALALTSRSPRLFEPKETVEGTAPEAQTGSPKEVRVEIEVEGAGNRIMAFPLPAGSYWGLQPVKDGLVYFNNEGMQRFNIKEQKNETILPGVRFGIVSNDERKVLYEHRDEYGVVNLAPSQRSTEGRLDLTHLTMQIDPRQEWYQLFNDGWRIFRDFFYVSNLHNVDWEGIRRQYAQLLPYLNHRFDLDFIFGEMIGESNTSHAYVDYGYWDRPERIQGGLLGARLAPDRQANRFRITKIYQGENWNPDRRSPLTEQGMDIREGDYIISIEGFDVTLDKNPYFFLQNRVDKATRITVNSKPTTVGARTFTIRPIASEQELKYLDWVNSRREMVHRLSNGRIGYIHVPNTAQDGNRELHRGMYAYHHKDAMIFDVRFNGGGFIPDRMTELLTRQTHALWHVAGLQPMRTPRVAHDGPKVMLINQYSSSGGDAFPHFFRQEELGTLIGTRTWGGLVGMTGNARLADGGYIGVPRFGIYNQDGEWIIEGIGIYPDIEVVDKPHLVARGNDPALERAVEVLLKKLEENPPVRWQTPVDPDRSRWIEVEIR